MQEERWFVEGFECLYCHQKRLFLVRMPALIRETKKSFLLKEIMDSILKKVTNGMKAPKRPNKLIAERQHRQVASPPKPPNTPPRMLTTPQLSGDGNGALKINSHQDS